MDANMKTGSVCLIGAGCSCSDLITLRGHKKLMKADVVVYDDLLDADLLDQIPDTAEKIYVGKRSGRHSSPQEEINRLLVSLAKRGLRVCRLKGGDSFVFGRGGEEILALQEAGIPWEVVPGVSSCIAIPELAGIPVTHRGVSRSFHVITAHTAGAEENFSEQLRHLAALDGTLVFLMGLGRLAELSCRLMDCGKPGDTPAAVLGDRTVRGTLADIAEKAAGVQPPAIILVGGSAGVELGNAQSLTGVRVGLTGTRGFRQNLFPVLKRAGACVENLQNCKVEISCSAQTLAEKLTALQQASQGWLAFSSPRGVDSFFRLLGQCRWDLRKLSGLKIAAVGPGTEKRLEIHGIYADLISEKHDSAAMAEQLLQQCSADDRILFLQSDTSGEDLLSLAERTPAACDTLELYRIVGGEVNRKTVDYLVFGSAAGVREYFGKGGIAPAKAAVCVGNLTEQAAAAHGLRTVKTALPSAEAILERILNLQGIVYEKK